MNDRKNKGYIHKGHRNRLRKKIVENNSIILEDHEILELLLFYSIFRRNTNEIAHNLLWEFDNLSGVLDKSPNELMKIPYIKHRSAALIVALGELKRRYEKSNKHRFSKNYTDSTRCVQSIAQSIRREGTFIVLTDKNGETVMIWEMNRENISVLFSKLADRASFQLDICGAIIFRYSNEKYAIPSSVELEKVTEMSERLDICGISLYEYFIICGDEKENVYDVTGIYGAERYELKFGEYKEGITL